MLNVALHYFVTIPYFIPEHLKYYKKASKTSKRSLPADLNVTVIKLQDQENLLPIPNHRPVLPLFYTHSLATT